MLAGDTEVQARLSEVEELLRQVCDADEFPWFVSDEATVLDVCTLLPEEIAERLAARYGRRVQLLELQLPIWKLVERVRSRS
jgi:hypothetical protein